MEKNGDSRLVISLCNHFTFVEDVRSGVGETSYLVSTASPSFCCHHISHVKQFCLNHRATVSKSSLCFVEILLVTTEAGSARWLIILVYCTSSTPQGPANIPRSTVATQSLESSQYYASNADNERLEYFGFYYSHPCFQFNFGI